MKFDFLQKQTSRRDILRSSITLAGSAFLAYRTALQVVRKAVAIIWCILGNKSFEGMMRSSPLRTLKLTYCLRAAICPFERATTSRSRISSMFSIWSWVRLKRPMQTSTVPERSPVICGSSGPSLSSTFTRGRVLLIFSRSMGRIWKVAVGMNPSRIVPTSPLSA